VIGDRFAEVFGVAERVFEEVGHLESHFLYAKKPGRKGSLGN
jgi:hypothetical protein